MTTPTMAQRLGAELLGTFWLVFGGCGSAVFAAVFLAPNVVAGQSIQLGIGFVGVALAFGLTVMTMAYAVGHISGAHFNPAVTIGVAVARRFGWKDVPAYIGAQVVGGLLAGLAVWGIARGRDGFDATGNLAANGSGGTPPVATGSSRCSSPRRCSRRSSSTSSSAPPTRPHPRGTPHRDRPVADPDPPHLHPISNTSVNPARSTGVAFFNGDGAPGQLWLFWLAPIVGAAIGGATFHLITGRTSVTATSPARSSRRTSGSA